MKSRILLGLKKGGTHHMNKTNKNKLCTRADETYVVSIDIDDVPVGHHDVPCQNPNEHYMRSIQQLINASKTNQEPQSTRDGSDTEANAEFALDVALAASSTATETAPEEGEVIGNCAVDNDTVDPDDDIWSGKRSQERKQIDSIASVRLLEIIKDRWEVVRDKKITRRVLFSSIAAELRQKGVNISRKPDLAWVKVYGRWNKLKESYKTYTDSILETEKDRPNHRRFTKNYMNYWEVEP
ncbi:hypothetical protein OUZ56_005504 [Daphnia magna]|uniref:MADF domain-containing protein n=1 Tax=Daphnia magna TaxID=35525 RepID=A0ABQ9YSZ0_9CRUS|nr:hypothetical protein OUZ56_005504 [Daphnia magna]